MFYLVHPRLNVSPPATLSPYHLPNEERSRQGATKVYNLLFTPKLKTPPLSPTGPNGLDDRASFSSPISPTRAAAVPLPQSPTSPQVQEDVFAGFTRIPRAVKE